MIIAFIAALFLIATIAIFIYIRHKEHIFNFCGAYVYVPFPNTNGVISQPLKEGIKLKVLNSKEIFSLKIKNRNIN